MENNSKKIIIAERDNIAAIMEGKKVSEFFVHRGEVLLGDIYLATVENILPSIEAAFVDVGQDKMGFLHAQDVIGKGSLKDKLSPKQKIIVQVIKEPTGHKGPRVTTEISLPGRFLVLIPEETGISVSRKIESVKEKARLKSIVNLLKPVGVGVIIRTEAEGQSDSDIQEDLEVLLEKWNNIVTAGDSLTPPNLIYRDQDLLYRVIREACTDDISEIVVDTTFAMNRVQQLLQNWHMNRNIEVSVYKGNEPLLIATDIHKEIKNALQTKVHMPSGGYLYIQTTEALTVIDVNSGKFISSATQDETILRTNKEAVQEIAKQLKLRNIGGMIIIDFIDMTSRVDKLAILEELEIAIENDKSKPQIGQLSDLGLVELTRHRQGQSLAELFTKKCPHCQGNGYIMEDFKFASPTSEGEYRAKAAKLKLPVNNFKKNAGFKKPDESFKKPNVGENAEPQGEQQNVQTFGESQGEQTQTQYEINKNRNRRNNKFNRNKNKINQPTTTQEQLPMQPMQPNQPTQQGEERPMQVAQPAQVGQSTPIAVQPAQIVSQPQPVTQPTPVSAQPTPVVAQPTPVVREVEKRVAAPVKRTPQPVKERAVEEKSQPVKETTTVDAPAEEKPKTRGRRPNRNTSKKPKTNVEAENAETKTEE